MSTPYLSLAMICRDPEGAPTLERCLRSVVERPGGSLVDEIVVVLGGKPNEKVREIAERFGASVHDLPSGFPLSETGGLSDFAAARNYSFSLCKGVWLGWIDSDDVWPSAERVREYFAVREDTTAEEVKKAPTATLKDFLRSLPRQINAVVASYHYDIASDDRVLNDSPRIRFVRWGDGWTWHTWGLGCHEDLIPVAPNHAYAADLRSLFIEHRPTQSQEERLVRNARLIEDAAAMGAESWRLHHYLARTSERRNDYRRAIDHDKRAIGLAGTDEERYMTQHSMARCLRAIGAYDEARASALQAYYLCTGRGEALADLIHIAIDSGQWYRAIEWYERLVALPAPQASDYMERHAYETELWPHISAARAYIFAQQYEKAMAASKRGLAFAPYDVMAQQALAASEALLKRAKALEAIKTLYDYAMEYDEPWRAREIAERVPHTLETEQAVQSLVARAKGLETRRQDPGEPTETEKREIATAPTSSCVIGRELLVPDLNDDEYGCPFALRKAQWAPNDVKVVVPYGGHGKPANLRVITPKRLYEMVAPRAKRISRLEHVQPVEGDPGEGAVVAEYVPGLPSAPTVTVNLYCPSFAEAWGPWTPERTGIGASEEMVVLVAKKLAAEGASVFVYGPVGDLCVAEGVVYRPINEFDHREKVDTLISCRTALLAQCFDVGAKKHIVWFQDAPGHDPLEFFEAPCVERVTRYVLTSDTHAERYAVHYGLPSEKVEVCVNAPDPDDGLVVGFDRDPRRAVYCSAPYRGLDKLLDLWPRIHERVPDSELCVAYGWQVHDALARRYPKLAEEKKKIEEAMNRPNSGIKWLDRLPVHKLRDLLLSSGVFLYTTTFEEMCCRAILRAQACGCWPIYRPLAALRETALGGIAVDGVPGTPEFDDRFVDAVVATMTNPPGDAERQKLSENAKAWKVPWAKWSELTGLAAKWRATPKVCEVTL